MPQLDYTGAHGGQLAVAFAAGVTFASSILIAAGGFLWRFFFDARIKELQAERAADQKKCDADLARVQHRVDQLETILLTCGSPLLRQQLQFAITDRAASAEPAN